MPAITLNAYPFFTHGKCREAMEFYQGIFGGELSLRNYEDMEGNPMPDMAGKVAHAFLSGGDIDLMASDSTRESFEESFISLSLTGTDDEKMRGIFDALAEGGKVDYPLHKEEWGDIFGSVTDKYGINWMVNIG